MGMSSLASYSRSAKTMIGLLLLATSATAADQTCSAAIGVWRQALSARVPLAASTGGAPPISFVLDGKNSSTFLPAWRCAATDTQISDGRRLLSVEWTSPTSLAAKASVTLWPVTAGAPPAVEWVLEFANHNDTHRSGVITDANALDATWALPNDATLETARGSDSNPADYGNMSYSLTPAVLRPFRPANYYNGRNGTTEITAGAGRSSNGQMPFFALESESAVLYIRIPAVLSFP